MRYRFASCVNRVRSDRSSLLQGNWGVLDPVGQEQRWRRCHDLPRWQQMWHAFPNPGLRSEYARTVQQFAIILRLCEIRRRNRKHVRLNLRKPHQRSRHKKEIKGKDEYTPRIRGKQEMLWMNWDLFGCWLLCFIVTIILGEYERCTWKIDPFLRRISPKKKETNSELNYYICVGELGEVIIFT
jgi:hypothetical protein